MSWQYLACLALLRSWRKGLKEFMITRTLHVEMFGDEKNLIIMVLGWVGWAILSHRAREWKSEPQAKTL